MTKAVTHSHNNNVAMVIECSVTLQKEQYKTWLSQDIILKNKFGELLSFSSFMVSYNKELEEHSNLLMNQLNFMITVDSLLTDTSIRRTPL